MFCFIHSFYESQFIDLSPMTNLPPRKMQSKAEVGSGGMLSKLPGDIQACNWDRLSELPADVLLNILERVGTLDVVRTCILSKQMQKLPAMLSQIVIDLSPRDLFQKSDVVADVTNKILNAFAGLTRLHLRNMRFGESDIPNILSNCKRLESLSFFMCGVGIGSVLHVEHTQLVELVMSYCVFKTVDLSSLPKLQRMTFGDWPCDENPLVLGFVPQLSKISLANPNFSGKTHNLSKLLANAPTVNDLFLEFRSEKIWVQPECPRVLAPVLARLRFVNLDHLPEECDISWTMFLLEAAPSVEDLCIIVWDHKCRKKSHESYSKKTEVKWEASDPDFKHKNLARLTIYGFQSDGNFTRYVRRVIQAAVNIRKVSLHDRKACQLCAEKFPHAEVRPSGYPRTSKEMDSSRKKMAAASAAACPDIHFCS
ncbi:uncharacterized protein LOC125515502 isoform X3 [Triticum urartu]|uniref:uncharacterized protein LOC125515502 isoform X3 n=1 Tax=Triticum urartu TaxID=4572 RepID=UPI002044C23F|nr:uncharacterized protein LOC125515502 isoform X3 [Triticum urartu]